jgi:hypothetical protein
MRYGGFTTGLTRTPWQMGDVRGCRLLLEIMVTAKMVGSRFRGSKVIITYILDVIDDP